MPTVNASWNGATADWNTPADWSDDIVPNSSNSDVTLDSSGAYTISIAAGESFTTGTVLLNDANAAFDIAGILDTGALTVGPGTVDITGTVDATGAVDISGGFTNSSALNVDNGTSQGGSSLTITGTLANTGAVQVGPNNFTLGAQTTVTLGGLTNATGASFVLDGSAAHAATLAFSGSGFTENDGTFQLVYATPLTLSSSVTNKGAFSLNDNTALTVDGGFTNSSALNVDNGTSQGGSSLTITGTLANTGAVQVGPNNFTLGAQTTVTLGGLTNATGASFVLDGSAAHAATLAFSGSGFTENDGTFQLVYATPLTLSSSVTNKGAFSLNDNTALTVDGGFTNSSALNVDNGTSQGGSSLTITGTLANTGAVQVGPNNFTLGAQTTVTLGGLTNATGASFVLDGSAAHAATLILNGAASNSGILTIGSFGVLDVTSVGSLDAANGSKIDISAGSLTNLSGTTLTGGAYEADTGSTIQLPNNATVATLAASLTFNGIGSVVEGLNTTTSKQVPIESTLTTIATGGALNVAGGRSYTTANTIADAGALQIGGGGTFTAAAVSVAGGAMLTVGASSSLNLSSSLIVDGTLTNAGTINGGGATAVQFGSGTDRLILDPGATFLGTVVGGGANTTLELAAGSGAGTLNALGTTFTNFGTVTVDAGATWTVEAVATALAGTTIIGNDGLSVLKITTPGTFSLGGVSNFTTIDLAAGNNTVTVTDTTLSSGPVTIIDGASGNNSISAAGDTAASAGKTLTYVTETGTDSFVGGFENDTIDVSAATVGGDTLTGGRGTNTLMLTSAGTFSLGGVSKFATIDLASGNNTVTVTDTTLSGGSVTINDGASGNNSISTAADTAASAGKTLTYVTGTGPDSFAGGFENDTVDVSAAAVGGDTLTGGRATNTLVLTSAGTFSLGGVSKFATIDLASGNSTVTVTNTTLSGGSVTINDGASGNNEISAAGDTSASKGKTLTYNEGSGTDSFAGGFENDTVYVSAAAFGGDVLTGGSGTNTLVLTSAGTFSLGRFGTFTTIDFSAGNNTVSGLAAALSSYVLNGGSGTNTLVLTSASTVNLGGVSGFGTIDLSAGNNTVTVTDTTLSGGSVLIRDGASGNNSISAAGDTAASKGKTLSYSAGTGTDSFAGGFENDVVSVLATAVDGDTLTGGRGTNTLLLRSAGTFSLSGVSKFGTIDLFTGNNTVTVTDTMLSGGSVTINDGASGNNTISAAGDTSASAGKLLTYHAGSGPDSFAGGFENDTVYVSAAAFGSDVLTGGSGTNTLVMTSAGTFNLSRFGTFTTIDFSAGNNTVSGSAAALSGYVLKGGSGTNTLVLTSAGTVNLGGVSGFSTIDLASGNNTVTVTDTTLSGGSVLIRHGASGNNSISAVGDTAASKGETLSYSAGTGMDSFAGGFENDVVSVLAAAVDDDTLTGGRGTNTLLLRSAGTLSLSGVSKFGTIDLFTGNNTVTVTDTTLSGGSVTINDGASGNNTISAAGDTSASAGKLLTYHAGSGPDSFAGGFENDTIYVSSAAVGGEVLTGGSGTNTLVLRSVGAVSLGGVSRFGTIDLFAGNNTVTVTDTTLSGGSVLIRDGASGNNSISAAGDTSASKGETLSYSAGTGTDSFAGGSENDVVSVLAAAVGGDVLTGGSGTNTLVLRSAGMVSLGGVSRFGTIDLASGNNTVTVTDTTLSGGSVLIRDGASGNNSISAAGDTSASKGETLSYSAGTGTDSFAGGSENYVVSVLAAAVGGDVLTGGSGTNTLVLRSAGMVSLGGVSRFGTIDLASGNSTVTVTDATLSGGSVALHDGASGNNNVSAAGDTAASKGKSLIYFEGTGTDSFTGGFENDTIYVSSAAVGGDVLTGGSGTNTLVLTSAGPATLNAADADLIVKLDHGTNLTLSTMSFITADGSSGNDTITALAQGQTMIGGAADTLIGFSGFGNTFAGTSAGMNGDMIKLFGGSDVIDLTDMSSSTAKALVYTGTTSSGTLTVADGIHTANINFTGDYTTANFQLTTDHHGGSLISFV